MSFIARVRAFFRKEIVTVDNAVAAFQTQVKQLGLAAALHQDEALAQQALINAATKAKAFAEAEVVKAKEAAVAIVTLVNSITAVKAAL